MSTTGPHRAGVVPALLIFVPLLGCASALREPPSLDELRGRVGDVAPDRVEMLIAQAESAFGKRTERSVRRAADLWLRAAVADPTRVDAWNGATRALVRLGDRLEDEVLRRAFASTSVDVAQWCGRSVPGDVRCDYWLAIALGIQARERRSTGLDAMPRMVELLERAVNGDPAMDRGGPHRVLALVYLRAPGWPTGPGDPDLGLDHAERALAVDPDYTPNLLAWAEALAEVQRQDESDEAYRRALATARAAVADGTPDSEDWVAEAERALKRKSRRR